MNIHKTIQQMLTTRPRLRAWLVIRPTQKRGKLKSAVEISTSIRSPMTHRGGGVPQNAVVNPRPLLPGRQPAKGGVEITPHSTTSTDTSS